MDNKEKLTELQNRQSKLWSELAEINSEITKIELEGYNFTGKYIHIPDYGNMYVTWQKIDVIDGRKYMFLQGFAFDGYISPYRDDFGLSIDAMDEWNIPLNTFETMALCSKIKEMTNDEFVDEIKEALSTMMEKYGDMLERVIKEYETIKNGDTD